jgi:mono/diheme cytochrome c family protein
MMRTLALFFVVVAVGCDVPTPLAPAEPIGDVPTWGDSFAVPTQQPASQLGNFDPAHAPDAMGNSGLPAGTQSPGDTGEWGGGDAEIGKSIWTAMCAQCHGQHGEGGAVPGGAKVPALADAAVQGALSDKQMARSIALGKGAMPGFMRDLDKAKLAGVIAHIRSLKR